MFDYQYIIAGSLTGFIIGLTGIGGGALMTPLLLFLFKIETLTAIGTDLWFAVITKIFGVRAYTQKESIDWKIVKYLWMGSLPIAILTVFFVHSGIFISKQILLTKIIGGVILLTSVLLLLNLSILDFINTKNKYASAKSSSYKKFFTIFCGAVLGLCITLTSVGAGVLGTIIIIYLYPKITAHRLIATDLMHAIPLAFVGAVCYFIAGSVNF